MSTSFIVTGMDFSGVSLTASVLQTLGINFAHNLVPRDFSNSKEDFEKQNLLFEFQRSVLKDCCRQEDQGYHDWGWTESEWLDSNKFYEYVNTANNLIEVYNQKSNLWGWQDPLTSLMLDFWNELLPDSYYLFLYGLPWDVADSLLTSNNRLFHTKPDYTLKIWAFYNRHILNFYQKHTERCLLININNIINRWEYLVELIDAKFGFNFSQKYDYLKLNKILNANISQNWTSQDFAIQLFNKISPQYLQLLSQLDSVADIPSKYISENHNEALSLESLLLLLYRDLKQANFQLQKTQEELSRIQYHLKDVQENISAMESSSFWKLRSQWFNLRQKMGITNNAESFSPQKILELIAQKLSVNQPKIEIIEQQIWPKYEPLVSIIIPCFNYGKYLEEAIDSVLAQTLQDLEIIVIDDGSDDPETIEILDNLNKQKTRVIRESNQKLPAARNHGIKLAKGKYICCLDADDMLKPTYLEKCILKMENENLDVCYSWQKEFGYSDFVWQAHDFELNYLINHNCCIVPTVFKRSIWQKVGGYNEQMINGYEDWDFWLKIAKAGGIGARIDEPLFLYRKHGHSMIDETKEKHKTIYETIKNNHQELFKNQNLITKIKNNRKKYVVKNSYINLLRNNITDNNVNSINVLFMLPYMVIGGAETVSRHVIKACKEANYNVTVITTVNPSEDMGDATQSYEELVQDIHQLPKLFKSQEQWKDFLFYLIESRKIKIIFLAGSTYGYEMLPEIKSRFPSLKVMNPIYVQDIHLQSHNFYKKYIDLTILENQSLDSLVEVDSSSNNRKILIHNGVDTTFFDSEAVDKFTLSQVNTNIDNKFVISFMGRFSEQKAPDIFIEIAKSFKNDEDVHFIMCGNGDLDNQIKSLIKKYELQNKIELPGFVDVRNYLKVSNLLIVPSRWEGRPNIVLESLSMGVPVIASPTGGLPWIIKNGFNGFLCELDNIDDFVSRIRQVILDKNLYQQMIINAREDAVRNLDVSIMHKEYIKLFETVIKR
jgi:glycosyltransferase involved in cell wall biosynthesis/GT2 family glycosyltransferase